MKTYTVDSALKLLSETRTMPKESTLHTQTYRYLYMGPQRIARVETDLKTQKDRVVYYHNDPMGTPIMMTIQDTASTQNYYAVSHQAMDPWGVELRAGYFTGTDDVMYTQKTLDQNTGLYDFGYRFYDRDTAQFLGQDWVPPQYETPLTLNTFQFCLNNPNVYVDPDGRDWFDSSNFMSGFSMKSMFDQAFKTDFGESSDRFMEKLPSRMAKVPGYLGEKGLEMGGDAVQAVPSSVYSGVSLATMVEAPYISAAANYLGGIKNTLDYSEGKISGIEFSTSLVFMGISAANPVRMATKMDSSLANEATIKLIDVVRGIPAFTYDLFSDYKAKMNRHIHK